jgi:hypothetical protein
MRAVIVSSLMLSGCGSCDDKADSESPAPPIVRWDAGARRLHRPRALPAPSASELYLRPERDF